MNDDKSDLLDTTDGDTLTNEDRDDLREAPRSGNSPHPTGVAGTVMSDESYVGRGESSGLSQAANSAGALGQTVNPGEIEAAQSSELGNETDISGGVSNLNEINDAPVQQNDYNR